MKLKLFVQSKINKYRPGLHVYWWRGSGGFRQNFGDEITPVIIDKIWGIKCHWTRVADCDIVGAGSIVDIVRDYNPEGHRLGVWGSGFIEEGASFSTEDVTFHLVRGPLTARRIQKHREEVALGDPGLLVSRVFPASKPQRSRVGVVPHMKDLDAFCAAFSSCATIISPHQTPEKVAADISSCEIIFSSSLHGLIFADSYNIPNFRVTSHELEGGNYKFRDYYGSTNRKVKSYSVKEVSEILTSPESMSRIRATYQPISNLSNMQDTIMSSFPLKSVKW